MRAARSTIKEVFRFTLLAIGLTLNLVACASDQANSNPQTSADGPLLVAAASDLQFAFSEIGDLFEEQTGHRVIFTFGSTGNLTSQIENGAPFDILAAANVDFIHRLREKGLIIPETQQLYAQGRIVLALNRAVGVRATGLQDLLDPAISRVAIANPDHAPYGLAAMQALKSEGVWEAVQPKLVYGENVRQTLQFVQTGDAPVGIVALSIVAVPEVTHTMLDPDLYQPLNQTLAVVRGTPREATARAFIDFVNSPDGRAVMKKYHFLLPGEF